MCIPACVSDAVQSDKAGHDGRLSARVARSLQRAKRLDKLLADGGGADGVAGLRLHVGRASGPLDVAGLVECLANARRAALVARARKRARKGRRCGGACGNCRASTRRPVLMARVPLRTRGAQVWGMGWTDCTDCAA